MNFTRFILRDFRHYRKAFLAILAGTIISTAVLTGALILGDSVKFSLRHITEIRLSKIRYALRSQGRYFRQDLANEMSDRNGATVAPIMLSEGMTVNPENNARINRVQIVGIDRRFRGLWEKPVYLPDANTTVISKNTAEKLSLKRGDDLLLRISKQGIAPAYVPFVSEKSPMIALRLKIKAVVEDGNMGRFSLNNNQSAPYSVFISLDRMAELLDLKGLANVLLMAEPQKPVNPDSLFRLLWQPEDAGLDIHPLRQKGEYEITSGRIFIDTTTLTAVKSALPQSRFMLTYLVNSFCFNGRSAPYSFVTAVSPDFLGEDPGADGIIINSWLASDLGMKPGDSLKLSYFIMGRLRQLREDSSMFVVSGIRPMDDTIWDRSLMPDFPGMSKAVNCRDWETGAPIDLKRIRDKDEKYWNEYRGTPKAFISLASGQKLWSNPFGNITAIRFNAKADELKTIGSEILKKLSPEEKGLVFIPVFKQGITSASGSTDFGSLFISLGLFIILSALMLTALLVSLHISTRRSETGILSAIGFRYKAILRIIVTEILVISVIGGISGALTGIFYTRLMIHGLNTLWIDAVGTSALEIHTNFISLVTGAFLGIFTALLFMLTALYRNLRRSVTSNTAMIKKDPAQNRTRSVRGHAIFAGSLLLASLGIVGFLIVNSRFTDTTMFLISGALFLAGGCAGLNLFLIRHSLQSPELPPGFISVSLKNAGLNRSRTMTVLILLALGTFSIFITGANRKSFFGSGNEPRSGSGGFQLWAETSIPLRYDLNSSLGIKKYGLEGETCLDKVQYTALECLDGDDASCLNLNRVAQPSILGIPPDLFDQRNAFSFLAFDPSVDKVHPWKTLREPLSPGLIPAFADQTIITWGMSRKIGDTLYYRSGSGEQIGIKLMGGLDNSVFQGYLLISDSLFRIYYPSTGGSKILLIDAARAKQDSVSKKLEQLFRDYGMMVKPTSERLASFNAVENTYLSVFMILGSLGVIIGTFGLGIILLRNLLERKRELAIYQALGFTRKFILKLIIAEYCFILLAGTGLGIISALIGMLPSLISPAFHLPGIFLLLIILAVLFSGFLWIWITAKVVTARKDKIQTEEER